MGMSRTASGILFRFLAVMLLALLPAAAMAADITVNVSAPQGVDAKGMQDVSVSYRFTNPNPQAITGMGIDIDMLTVGREWRATGALIENSCGGTFSVTPGGTIGPDYDPSPIVGLRNGAIPANSFCVLTYAITPARKITASRSFSASFSQALPAGMVFTDQGFTNAASNALGMQYRIGTMSTMLVGGVATLNMDVFTREEADVLIRINGYTAAILPGLAIPVTIPPALDVLSMSTACGTIVPRTGGVTWNLDLPAAPPEPTTPRWGASECLATVRVRPNTGGLHTINIGNGRYPNYHVTSSMARVNATVAPLNVAMAFVAPTVTQGGDTTLRIDIVNSLAAGVANDRHGATPSITLALPAWMTVAGVATTTCPGATAGVSGGVLQMSGGIFAGAATCSLFLPVNAAATGGFSLAFPAGTLKTTEGGSNPKDVTASLRVLSAPVLSLSAAPNMTGVGRTGEATLGLSNPNASAFNPEGFTNLSFDLLQPAGLDFSAAAPVSTCSGFSAVAEAGRLVISGINLPPAGSCTFTLPATGTSAGLHTVQSGNMTAADIGAIASLPLSLPWRVVADPLLRIFALVVPEMEVPFRAAIELENTNPVAISMSGSGLVLPLPQSPGAMRVEGSAATVSGCGAAVLSAPAGGASLSLSGGTLPAAGTCRVEVDLVTPEGGAHVFQPQGLVLQYGTVVLSPITLSVQGGPIPLQIQRSIQVLDEHVDDLADCAALDDSAASGLHAVPGACLEIEISIVNPASETRIAHAVEAREIISPHLSLAAWDQGELDSLIQDSGLLVAAITALPPGEERSFSYRAMVQ